jgi:hypothetical protein
MNAYKIKPELAKTPIAAVHHIVAAVFKPRTFTPSLKIIPLHKKPRPVTICPAILVRSGVSKIKENMTNIHEPKLTSTLVRIPAGWPVNCLSNPIRNPNNADAAILITKSNNVI